MRPSEKEAANHLVVDEETRITVKQHMRMLMLHARIPSLLEKRKKKKDYIFFSVHIGFHMLKSSLCCCPPRPKGVLIITRHPRSKIMVMYVLRVVILYILNDNVCKDNRMLFRS